MGVVAQLAVASARILGQQVWDVSVPAGGLALVGALVAAVATWGLWRATAPGRPTPGPATAELRPETPAVVGLLTADFEVDDDAVPATVVDLASRGHLDIDDRDGQVLLRPHGRGAQVDEALTAYERRVLRHVERRSVEGTTPARALAVGPDGPSLRWFRAFAREVVAHGRTLGLCRRRWGPGRLVAAWGLVALAWAPIAVVARRAPRSSTPSDWARPGNVLLGLAVAVALAVTGRALRAATSDARRGTAAGLAAAAHWLGVRDHLRDSGRFDDEPATSVALWGRDLAYATVLGLAPVTQRQLPFERDRGRHGWSRATGRWRRVRIDYEPPVPGWGQAPRRALGSSLLRAAAAGVLAVAALWLGRSDLDGLADGLHWWLSVAALVAAVLLAVAAVRELGLAVTAAADLRDQRTVEGEVVRTREQAAGGRVRCHVAVDDGTDDRIVAFEVRPEVRRAVAPGDRVRVTVTRRLGHVSSLELLRSATAPAAPARGLDAGSPRRARAPR